MTKARTGVVDRRRKGTVSERRLGFDRERYSVDGSIEDIRRSYVKIYGNLLSYARGRVGSQEAAHDIVQEAFTNTLAAAERGALLNNVDGFLYRCVQNLCINHARREPPLSMNEEVFGMTNELNDKMTEQSAGSSASQRERWREVEGIVKQLAPSQRYVFLLAEVRGFRYEEIARSMGKSVESIRQLLSRARKKVRAGAGASSDRIGGSIPVIGAGRIALPGGDSSTGLLAWLRNKMSELNVWVGGLMQRSLDLALQSGLSLTAGAAVVALLAVSSGPPVQDRATGTESIASKVGSLRHTVAASLQPAVAFSPRISDSGTPGLTIETEERAVEDRSGGSHGKGVTGENRYVGATADTASESAGPGDTLAPPPPGTIAEMGSNGSDDGSLSGDCSSSIERSTCETDYGSDDDNLGGEEDENSSDLSSLDAVSEVVPQGREGSERSVTDEVALQGSEGLDVVSGEPALPESEEPSRGASGDSTFDERLP